MTNQEILEKAIQKAIDGGWDAPYRLHEIVYPTHRSNWEIRWLQEGQSWDYQRLIFNHEFARALWGKEEMHHYDLGDLDIRKTTIVNKPRWHYHLQQMVIADDPIKYLGENL